MKQYVALLRGINVGGNNKVEMSRLKAMFEGLGFAEVSTYINSGNVIFASQKKPKAEAIETAIEETFGFPVRVLIRTEAAIRAVIADVSTAWKNDAEQKTDVMFLWAGYDSEKTVTCISTRPSVDTLVYIDKAGAIVWHLKKKNYSKSGMNDLIGTDIYKNMTVRNINTVRKLAALMGT